MLSGETWILLAGMIGMAAANFLVGRRRVNSEGRRILEEDLAAYQGQNKRLREELTAEQAKNEGLEKANRILAGLVRGSPELAQVLNQQAAAMELLRRLEALVVVGATQEPPASSAAA